MAACRTIAALYLYELGDMDSGLSIISSPMCPNESHTEWAVIPVDYTIEAEIDSGAEMAIINKTNEGETYYIIDISDSDIHWTHFVVRPTISAFLSVTDYLKQRKTVGIIPGIPAYKFLLGIERICVPRVSVA